MTLGRKPTRPRHSGATPLSMVRIAKNPSAYAEGFFIITKLNLLIRRRRCLCRRSSLRPNRRTALHHRNRIAITAAVVRLHMHHPIAGVPSKLSFELANHHAETEHDQKDHEAEYQSDHAEPTAMIEVTAPDATHASLAHRALTPIGMRTSRRTFHWIFHFYKN